MPRHPVLPAAEPVVFRRAPIKLVFGQVRVPLMPRFGEAGFVAPLHEALRAEYPRLTREQQVSYQLSPQGAQTTAGEYLWRLATRDGLWSVVVAEAAITLESRAKGTEDGSLYDITGLLARFERVLRSAKETFGIEERLRLGMRYINELRYPKAETLADWSKLLRPEFIGTVLPDLLEGRSDHMYQEVRVRRADGELAIRHGIIKGAVIGEPPQEMPDGSAYLIDLDYYDNQECQLDVEATIAQMRGYNDVLYRLFRWALTKRLYGYLEPMS
jgi:uncharacterized protein (TIGR04255 family)